MKKIHKKILGIFGIVAVAAITAVAAFMPIPKTQAISSMTDTITVRVVNSVPEVTIDGIENETKVTSPGQNFTVHYQNATDVKITIDFTDANGNKTTYLLDEFDADYNEGEKAYTVPNYGYGTYQINVRGEGYEGAWDSDAIKYYYYAAYAEEIDEGGKKYIDIYYDPDAEGEDKVDKIEIKIYDENGNEVPFSPLIVTPPVDRIELPFEEYGLPDGTYTVEVYAYNQDGKQLGAPYIFTVTYKSAGTIEVPDTGGLLQGTNISKTDYLVAGLVTFGLIAMAGVLFILRREHKKN